MGEMMEQPLRLFTFISTIQLTIIYGGFTMNPKTIKLLSDVCFIMGFASILGSITIWFVSAGPDAESIAHSERFGIFVGLWAPTFFTLSNRFDRYRVDEKQKQSNS
jgi:hypothetical protein